MKRESTAVPERVRPRLLPLALGWLAFVLPLVAVTSLGAALSRLGASETQRQAFQAVAMTTLVGAAILLLARTTDRAPLRRLGLPGPVRSVLGLAGGVLLALCCVGAVVALAVWLGLFDRPVLDLGGDVLLSLGVTAVLALGFEAFPEELCFRGYLLARLSATMHPVRAVVIDVVLFVAAPTVVASVGALAFDDDRAADPLYLCALVVFGVVLAALRLLLGSIWPAIGFHLCWLLWARFAVLPQDEAVVLLDDSGRRPDALDAAVLYFGPLLLAAVVLTAVGWRRLVRAPLTSP